MGEGRSRARARACRVCLTPLREDGHCVHRCDPQLAGAEQRRRRVEEQRLRERERKAASKYDRMRHRSR